MIKRIVVYNTNNTKYQHNKNTNKEKIPTRKKYKHINIAIEHNKANMSKIPIKHKYQHQKNANTEVIPIRRKSQQEKSQQEKIPTRKNCSFIRIATGCPGNEALFFFARCVWQLTNRSNQMSTTKEPVKSNQ